MTDLARSRAYYSLAEDIIATSQNQDGPIRTFQLERLIAQDLGLILPRKICNILLLRIPSRHVENAFLLAYWLSGLELEGIAFAHGAVAIPFPSK